MTVEARAPPPRGRAVGMAAGGMTRGQVAEALGVSRRTI